MVGDYTPKYPDPLTARAGDRVLVGTDDPEYPGWRWCTGPDGRMGWVPEQWLRREGPQATMLRDYTARELSVRAGADVRIVEAVSGWVWVTDARGQEGWIPQTCVALASSPRGL